MSFVEEVYNTAMEARQDIVTERAKSVVNVIKKEIRTRAKQGTLDICISNLEAVSDALRQGFPNEFKKALKEELNRLGIKLREVTSRDEISYHINIAMDMEELKKNQMGGN